MFWRKKPPSSDELFVYESRDRRESFRISPPDDEPVWLRIAGQKVKILNLGAGGLSFQASGMRVGEKLGAAFALPPAGTDIAVTLEVIEVNPPSVCHCRFRGLAGEAVERIHKYMLAQQKAALKERKQGKGGGGSG